MKRSLFALPIAALLALGLSACGPSSSNQQQQTTATAANGQTSDTGTQGVDFNSRPSDAPRINVQLVQQALSDVQQSDPQGWLQDFEKRVNQIYEGDDGVVSIDAKNDANNNLQIVGYISKSGQQGYQAGVDDQIFSIQQTAPVADGNVQYRMSYNTYNNQPVYFDGYYHNPFMTAWMVHTLIYGQPWGYYTSPAQIVVLHSYRTTYRASPAYYQQRVATQTYYHQAYHGAPVTVRPGSTLATTVRPGAPAAAAVHVAPPAAPAPASITPQRGAGSGIFNRGAGAAAPVAAPAANSYKPSAAPGGLFSNRTYSSPRSTYTPSRSSGSRRR